MPSPSMAPYWLNTPIPEAYPCSHTDCGRQSVAVEVVPFNRHGMTSSVAFYGYCDEHKDRRIFADE